MSARSHSPVSVATLSMLRVRILLLTWNSCYASTKMNPLIYKSKLLYDRQRIDCAKNRKSLFASLPKKPACFRVIQENAFESAQPLETWRRNVHFWLNTIMQLYANLFSRLQSPSKRPHFSICLRAQEMGDPFWLLSPKWTLKHPASDPKPRHPQSFRYRAYTRLPQEFRKIFSDNKKNEHKKTAGPWWN